MCETCGCGLPEEAKHAHEGHGHDHPHREEARLYRSLLEANERQALENREHLLEHRVLAVNLMSGPGSGKTSLIEALARLTAGRWRIGVIEGDLATDRDAARVRALGLPVRQVTTGSTCHLDAAMVHGALHALPLEDLDLLVVENVGNLVCPGLYDLGCHLNGVLLSVTEGDDKVAKYPVAFRHAQFFCITKTDLLPHVDFDVERPKREARLLKGDLKVFACSSRAPESLSGLAAYLEAERKALLG
ncbi:MAG: hydrogenase nickel incorporation protein HypB [Acidobacteriota bacterium]